MNADELRVIHLCYSDDRGGAAIGARRSHRAMLSQGIDSRLVVVEKFSDDPRVIALPDRQSVRKWARRAGAKVAGLQKSANPVIRTFNVLPMGTARFLNAMEGDVIQMHWIAAETISIGEIAALKKPVFWKLPDMWPFSGTEHYLSPGDVPRYKEGYLAKNRQPHDSGIDLDRLMWLYKRWRWRNADFSIVCPSKWIAECARESKLFGHRRIHHIPNPLDLDLYVPQPKTPARLAFGLPQDKRLIMFGAMYATQDRRKGFSHLERALVHLGRHLSPETTELVVLGADGPAGQTLSGFNVHYLGTIREEPRLVQAYNVADAFVLPAEADNLPNVVKEATCCGVPCAGFNIGGMPDMIDHLDTGYLAQPFDAEEMARGIAWVTEHATPELSAEVRRRAEAKHSYSVAVGRYLEYYREVLASVGAR